MFIYQSIILSLRKILQVMEENILSKNVKKIISEKGLQHRDVARLMGCDAASFSRMLSGNPRFDSILKIAEALSVSPKTLFEEDFGIEGLVRYKRKTFFFNSRDEFESITCIQRYEISAKVVCLPRKKVKNSRDSLTGTTDIGSWSGRDTRRQGCQSG